MFAVPGWSISADTLQAQESPKILKLAKDAQPKNANSTDKGSRKRKRGVGSSKVVDVTAENLGDLWKKYVERKILGEEKVGDVFVQQDQNKKRKRERKNDSVVAEVVESHNADHEDVSEVVAQGSIEGKRPNDEEETGNTLEHNTKPEGSDIAKSNNHIEVANGSPDKGTTVQQPLDAKAKYERRRAKTARRKEQRALQQADGTLPPTRSVTGHEIVASVPSISSNLDLAETTDIPTIAHEKVPPIATKTSAKASKHPKPPKPATTNTASLPPEQAVLPTNLTPLQQRMAAKLTSARFRHLNQILYTSPSTKAMHLFNESPQSYTSYHAGFRAQVAVWPQNPVEGFIEDVKTRGRTCAPSQKKMWREMRKGKKANQHPSSTESTDTSKSARQMDSLPRTRGVCTIADLGCGDAHLAKSLQPCKQSLNLNLLSFDLAKGDTPNAHLITVADISDLASAGVGDGSVDIAICCLSLMGTNWVDVIGECARAVRGGGEVWVAEIKSRFARPGRVMKKGDGIGKKKGKKGKGSDDDDDENVDDAALEEIEDIKGSKDETDVSAFVEVFRKRGLNLKGEPDMANKMFVRMRFTKAIRSERENNNDRGGKARFGDGFRGKQVGKLKFLDNGDEPEVDESKVLKPCVYKTR